MGRSRNAPSPMVKRTRPDKEQERNACDKAVDVREFLDEDEPDFSTGVFGDEESEHLVLWVDPELRTSLPNS